MRAWRHAAPLCVFVGCNGNRGTLIPVKASLLCVYARCEGLPDLSITVLSITVLKCLGGVVETSLQEAHR
jgi:hypothetical protein